MSHTPESVPMTAYKHDVNSVAGKEILKDELALFPWLLIVLVIF